MKFMRRPDVGPQTRIQIVMTAWLHQGVYGKMTNIAKFYQISRTFLSQLLFMANLQLETLLSDEKLLFQKDHRHFEQLILLLRLEGHCSLLSMSSILKALDSTRWNKQAAAALLGLRRPTLYSKMRKHNIPQRRP